MLRESRDFGYAEAVADLTFAQPTRRNVIAPILAVALLLGAAAGVLYYKASKRTVSASVTRTIVHPVKVFYKAAPQSSSFKVLKVQEGESDLYLIPTVRIENHLDVPLFIKDFTIAFETDDGGMHTSAIEKADFETVYSSFPEIRTLIATPLLRETSITPGSAVEGSMLAQFAIPQSVWDARKSASLTIDFYHAPSIKIPIPKT